MPQNADVIIPDGMKPLPEEHEIEIAWILARHYRCVVEFLQPTAGYKMKTPDIVMNGVMWEIKSPLGWSARSTVEFQFRSGLRQARSLVIDGRRTKLEDGLLQRQITAEKRRHRRCDRVIYISKDGKVVVIW
jgi:hypothetical protein